jgi:serine protease AprX
MQGASLSSDLLSWQASTSSATVRVIVPGERTSLEAVVERHAIPVVRWLAHGVVVRVTRAELLALAADAGVVHLSGDMPVSPATAVATQSTGADRAWRGEPAALPYGSIAGVNGSGVGIAVIDSGIAAHAALTGRVVASVSLVQDDAGIGDPYGHGTHVAGIIAGASLAATSSSPAFAGGIAPGAHLVNVRVLGGDGVGHTSDVIAGIDWVIAHRLLYRIRIINLSIGHPVVEPALTDPLCQAVARAAAAGLVVAVSAGNDGVSPSGVPVLGGIGSPGNSPFAVTVGALNTWATVSRGDDVVAEFSSRGPTRFDLAVKPDLVAPGTLIQSLEAAGSHLPATHPSIHVAGAGDRAYMRLSGTSMATPMVSAAAALLLQGSPGLTATQIKLALQSGAGFVRESGLMGAGAGSLDVWAARSITATGLWSVVGSTSGPGGVAFWDAGTLAPAVYEGVGVRLVSALDSLRLWANPSLLRAGELHLTGTLNPLRYVPAHRLIWGDRIASWASDGNQIIWGSTLSDSGGNQIIWGTSAGEASWERTGMTSPTPR